MLNEPTNHNNLDKVQSKTKLFLLILIGLSSFFSVIEFIIAIIHGYIETILLALVSVLLDGTLFLAIYKQCKKVIKIFRIIIIIIIILCILSSIAGVSALIEGKHTEKEQIIEDVITVIIGGLIYLLLAFLLTRYLAQISVSEQFRYTT